MTEPVKNLIQKAAAVMAVVQHVPKNGRNQFHNYSYATEADITECVRAEMANQGLMLIPSVQKVEWEKFETKNGRDRLCTLTLEFTLTDGIESRSFVVLGEGQDRGDKATYKAMTGGLKYALLKLFLIPTGDDPEKDSKDEEPKGRPERRQAKAPARPPEAAPVVERPPEGIYPSPEQRESAKSLLQRAEEAEMAQKADPRVDRTTVWARLTKTRRYAEAMAFVQGILDDRDINFSELTQDQLETVAAELDLDETVGK
jgi:ERF superfamily